VAPKECTVVPPGALISQIADAINAISHSTSPQENLMHRLAIFLLLSTPVFAQQTPASTGMVATPEVDLTFETFGIPGTATPVIIANGGPGLSHVYMLQNNVWPRIAQHRQVVFYDQRGTGKSKRVAPDAPFGMDAQVADLEAVRTKLGFQKFDLVGDSYGGLLAMAYAAAHPEHIEKLILSDSAAPAWKDIVRVLPDVFPDVLEQIAASEKNPPPGTNPADQGIRNHFLMLFYSEQNRDAYLAGAKDLGATPQVGAAVQKATRTLDLTPELPKFNFLTLVITGRFDMNVTPLTAWNIYKAIPGARFVVFEKSGHLPSYEEPDKYVQVVDTFLARP
jgi:proline iminopeptidase